MLAILVLALGLTACPAQVSEAAPMGTAFTYQGRLMETNKPANGFGLARPSVSIIVYLNSRGIAGMKRFAV